MSYSLAELANKLDVQVGAALCRRVKSLTFDELASIVGIGAAMALWEHTAAWHDAGSPGGLVNDKRTSLERLEKEVAVGESLKERTVARVIRDLNQLKWTDAEAETINVVVANLRDLYAKLGRC